MDFPSEGSVRQPGKKLAMKKKQTPPPAHAQNPSPQYMYSPYPQQTQLFHDTSMHDTYGLPNVQGYPPMMTSPPPSGPPTGPQQLFTDPMVASVAMNYGQALVGQGREIVDKNIEKYVSVSKIKYYFAVDTNYVTKKIGLLLFPYSQTDWSVKFNQDEPVAPRYEINAPDLYIPLMAFVTYILLTGYIYGTQNRFSPEQLGILASSTLGWLILEVFVIVFIIYITRLDSRVKLLDLIAFCGYKYVGMICCLLGNFILRSLAYYPILIYTSISIGFFLVRTLRLQLMPSNTDSGGATGHTYEGGSKRRLYLLLFIAVLQPVVMFWLTSYILMTTPSSAVPSSVR